MNNLYVNRIYLVVHDTFESLLFHLNLYFSEKNDLLIISVNFSFYLRISLMYDLIYDINMFSRVSFFKLLVWTYGEFRL